LTDFTINDQGTIVIISAKNRKARRWVKTFVSPEGYQPNYPEMVIVEPRYAEAVVKGIIADGFRVKLAGSD
jgi:hypothetical protein